MRVSEAVQPAAVEAAAPGNWSFIGVDDLLAGYSARWDALNRRLYGGHPLSDCRFVFALLRHFPGKGMRVAVLGSLEEPRAILLLEPVRPGFWRTFQRSQAQASPVLLAAEDLPTLPALFRALPGSAQAIDFMCQDPHFSPLLSRPVGRPRRFTRYTLTAVIDLRGHFDAYWRARPRGLRQTIARSLRRAEAEGAPLHLRTVEDPAAMEEAVRQFGLMESRGWKHGEGTAVSPDNVQGRFYAEVFRAFAETGQAISYELYAGEDAIARQLALASGHMCITLKTSYDERHRELAPGRVLDHEMLRLEFERRRFDRIELYTDADQAQLRWTTSDRWIEHVTCFRSAAAGSTYTIARALLTGLRRLSGGPAVQPGNS